MTDASGTLEEQFQRIDNRIDLIMIAGFDFISKHFHLEFHLDIHSYIHLSIDYLY